MSDNELSKGDLSKDAVAQQIKKGFYIHAGVYTLVNAGLVTLNMTRNPDKVWSYWVLGGWGAGVLLHGVLVFQPTLFERAVERRRQRLQGRSQRREARLEKREERQERREERRASRSS